MLCETLFQIFHFSSAGSFLSAQRCFAFHFLPTLFKFQYWNFMRVSVDYTCKCNAESSLWFWMSPLNSALLCFSRASCFVQVSIMKVFKSSVDYALRNFVSNLSFFFWWKSPVGTALLWVSRSSYFVQVSILKLFESFGGLHLQMWCWDFSLVFNVSTKQCAALLLSRFK